VKGIGYGFQQYRRNALRLLANDGLTLQFHSELVLLPEQRTGLFTAFNGQDALGAPVQSSRRSWTTISLQQPIRTCRCIRCPMALAVADCCAIVALERPAHGAFTSRSC
jgi:hypothetical protein